MLYFDRFMYFYLPFYPHFQIDWYIANWKEIMLYFERFMPFFSALLSALSISH